MFGWKINSLLVQIPSLFPFAFFDTRHNFTMHRTKIAQEHETWLLRVYAALPPHTCQSPFIPYFHEEYVKKDFGCWCALITELNLLCPLICCLAAQISIVLHSIHGDYIVILDILLCVHWAMKHFINFISSIDTNNCLFICCKQIHGLNG